MCTIKDNSDRDEQTKIDSAMLYLDVFHLNSDNSGNNNNDYDTNYQLIIEKDKLKQKVKFDVSKAKFRLELLIKNIGLNTATNHTS